MRKLLILFFLLLVPLAVSARRPVSRTASSARLNAVVSEFRHYDGVETVRLGWLATAAIKGAVRISAASDPDAAEAAELLRGVKNFTVFDYGDCDGPVRDRICRRIGRALEGYDLLAEFSSNGTKLQLFGCVDDRTGQVHDFVMHSTDGGALIFVNGKVSMTAVGKALAND